MVAPAATNPVSSAQDEEGKSASKAAALSAEEQQAWRKRLPLPARCAEYDPDPTDPDSFGARILVLNEKQTVVDARCMLGTYQPSHLIFLWDNSGGSAKALSFPVYQANPPSKTPKRADVSELWGETEFDASSRQLKVFSKFRQAGDCGWWALYSFSNDGVKLDEFHLKSNCDGNDSMNPQHWPAVRVQ
jgi:Protein of unknown function (DUF1176)